jgi:hypothetical protein
VLKRVQKDDKLALSLADDSPDCALAVVLSRSSAFLFAMVNLSLDYLQLWRCAQEEGVQGTCTLHHARRNSA